MKAFIILLGGLCMAMGTASGAGRWADIIDPTAKVEKVAGGFGFTEGPLWSPEGALLFSDQNNDTIFRWSEEKGTEVFRRPAGPSNGLTWDRQGRLLACEVGKRVSRTEKDARIVTVASHYDGKRFNSPNDIVVKSDGAVYFTDPTYGMRKPDPKDPLTAALGFRGVFRVMDGNVTLLARDFRQPNGLAFSPDERTLYVDDSEAMHIRAFDVRADGTLANGRVFATLREEGKEGVPDGLKVDVRGNVYCTGPGAVWVFAPDGTLLGKIPTPEVPANVAWGGADDRTLYITARTSVYRVRLKVPGVRPGPKTR